MNFDNRDLNETDLEFEEPQTRATVNIWELLENAIENNIQDPNKQWIAIGTMKMFKLFLEGLTLGL